MSRNTLRIEAVLFDLFGTLVESPLEISPYAPLVEAMDLAGEEKDAAFDLLLRSDLYSADDIVDALGDLFPGKPVSAPVVEKIQSNIQHHVESFSLVPGAVANLTVLRETGLRLGIVSNLSTPYKAVLSRLGLDKYFDECVFSCDTGLVKPEPEIFGLALAALGTTAAQTFMIGDNEYDDIEGAKSVGMRTILIGEHEQVGISLADACRKLLQWT